MKRKLFALSLILLLAVTLNACSREADQQDGKDKKATEEQKSETIANADSTELADFIKLQAFTLKALKSTDEKELSGLAFSDLSETPTLVFGENFLVAGKICNNFRGTGTLKGDVLNVSPVLSTRMACPSASWNQLEQDFFRQLESGLKVSRDGHTLKLEGSNHFFVFEHSK